MRCGSHIASSLRPSVAPGQLIVIKALVRSRLTEDPSSQVYKALDAYPNQILSVKSDRPQADMLHMCYCHRTAEPGEA